MDSSTINTTVRATLDAATVAGQIEVLKVSVIQWLVSEELRRLLSDVFRVWLRFIELTLNLTSSAPSLHPDSPARFATSVISKFMLAPAVLCNMYLAEQLHDRLKREVQVHELLAGLKPLQQSHISEAQQDSARA